MYQVIAFDALMSERSNIELESKMPKKPLERRERLNEVNTVEQFIAHGPLLEVR